jgi:hypothetical protein
MINIVAETLLQLANEIAGQHESTRSRLYNELFEIQTSKTQIEAKKTEIERAIHATRLAAKRASNYDPILGSKFRCPRCWINDGASNIVSLTSSEGGNDVWKCQVCGQTITLPRGQ